MAATTVLEHIRSKELVGLVGCDEDELMWEDETDVDGMDCKEASVDPAVRSYNMDTCKRMLISHKD